MHVAVQSLNESSSICRVILEHVGKMPEYIPVNGPDQTSQPSLEEVLLKKKAGMFRKRYVILEPVLVAFHHCRF